VETTRPWPVFVTNKSQRNSEKFAITDFVDVIVTAQEGLVPQAASPPHETNSHPGLGFVCNVTALPYENCAEHAGPMDSVQSMPEG
jgi:hypothetical protein